MQVTGTSARLSRKQFICIGTLAAIGGSFAWWEFAKPPIAKAAKFVKPKQRWGASEFNDFLWALPSDRMLELKKKLEMIASDANESALKGFNGEGHNLDVWDVQCRLGWLSSNILTYPFKDPAKIDYHQLVQWVSRKNGIQENDVTSETTFNLEQHLSRGLFIQQWDKLQPEDRQDLLAKVLKGVSAEALEGQVEKWLKLSGRQAFDKLRKAGRMSGYQLYRSLNLAIVSVARKAGTLLAEVLGLEAVALVGIITGPVGWAIMTAGAVGSLAYLGRADARKTATFVYQIHQLKIEAVAADGARESHVFNIE